MRITINLSKLKVDIEALHTFSAGLRNEQSPVKLVLAKQFSNRVSVSGQTDGIQPYSTVINLNLKPLLKALFSVK